MAESATVASEIPALATVEFATTASVRVESARLASEIPDSAEVPDLADLVTRDSVAPDSEDFDPDILDMDTEIQVTIRVGTEGTGDTEDTEATADTADTVDTADTEDTEDMEDTEDTADTEDMVDTADTETATE